MWLLLRAALVVKLVMSGTFLSASSAFVIMAVFVVRLLKSVILFSISVPFALRAVVVTKPVTPDVSFLISVIFVLYYCNQSTGIGYLFFNIINLFLKGFFSESHCAFVNHLLVLSILVLIKLALVTNLSYTIFDDIIIHYIS